MKNVNLENCENSTFFGNEITTLEQNHGDEQSGHPSEYECGIALKNVKSLERCNIKCRFLQNILERYKTISCQIFKLLLRSQFFYRTPKTKYYFYSNCQRTTKIHYQLTIRDQYPYLT